MNVGRASQSVAHRLLSREDCCAIRRGGSESTVCIVRTRALVDTVISRRNQLVDCERETEISAGAIGIRRSGRKLATEERCFCHSGRETFVRLFQNPAEIIESN